MTPAALALAATLVAATAPAAPPVHVLPGGPARALTMAFGFATLHNTQTAGVLDGVTVHIGDLPGCYRIRFVPEADPGKTSTVRMAKAGDAGAAGCPDDKATEWLLSGAEAQAVAAVVRDWSNGALQGAPPAEMIAAETFSITTSVVPQSSNTLEPGTIKVDLVASPAPACPPEYDYDPGSGAVTSVKKNC